MLTLLGLAAALAAPAAPRPAAVRERPDLTAVPLYRLIDDARPKVSIWTNSTNPYQRGDRVRVYLSAQTDAYVMVLRIDTDGRVRVLYPVEPWQDDFVRGGRTFEILGRDDDNAFDVDDYPGVGYVFAVASDDPIHFDQFVRGDHWDYRTIADGRVRGDPYVALTDFANQLVGQSDWDYDITSYDVEQHYDYPRFLCYDCHAYAAYSYWDPYTQYCPRFRIVVYNDPYYYPYYYGGRRVSVVRPIRPQPRFVFKDYSGTGQYVTQHDRRPIRPTGDGGQTFVPDRGRTGADLGGRGSIPAPQGFGRRPVRPDVSGGIGQPGQPPSREVQPDVGGIGPMRRPVTGGQGQGNRQDPNAPPQPDQNRGRRPEVNPPAGGQAQPQPQPRQPQGNEVRPERRPEVQPPQRVEPQRQPYRPPEEPRRVEPRNEAPPRIERPAPQPRVDRPPPERPRDQPPRGGGGGQPELRRRKP
ncbi:MAG TPA: DUF4384 domain-containing protein [Gemmatimonadales bacterium]|nr:DUF4384 domain-containing protein [Gemmatimonadales bacterium]